VKLSKYSKGLEGVFPFYYVRSIDYCVGCHAKASCYIFTRDNLNKMNLQQTGMSILELR